MHVIVPFADRIAYKVEMRERKVIADFKELKSRDNMEFAAIAELFCQVRDPKKVIYETENVDNTVRQHLEIELKKLVKSMPSSELLASADQIDAQLLECARANEGDWGMHIRYIDVQKLYSV